MISLFHTRRFNTSKQFESFVNINGIEQNRITAICHTAFVNKKGETISSAYLYFFNDTGAVPSGSPMRSRLRGRDPAVPFLRVANIHPGMA